MARNGLSFWKRMDLSTSQLILLTSGLIGALILIFGLLLLPSDTLTISYLIVGVISTLLFPYSFYEYYKSMKIKGMESEFPTFLKDLADSLRAGITMPEAIRKASKSDYHELNNEIKRLSTQLSWGVNFEDGVREMMHRLEKSQLIKRGLAVLLQAYKSGGDISPIMSSIADSTILLQDVNKDKESSMTEQMIIIYVIQFVFVGITIILFKVLLPVINTGGFGTGLLGGQAGSIDMEYYKEFFFFTLVIQSVCNGLVAGVTKSGSLTSGVKHVAFMFIVSLLLFSVFILPKTLSITAVSEKYSVTRGQSFSVFGTVKYDNEGLSSKEVTVILGNSTFTGSTDEAGDYSVTVIAPDERGEMQGRARVEHDGKRAEKTFTFNIR